MTLTEIVEKMSSVQAFVLGDTMLDEYIFGRVDRMCPEAPVPVFVPEATRFENGGAGHVADQLRALSVDTQINFGYPTCKKTRYMVGSHMLLRVDRDEKSVYTPEQEVEGAVNALECHKVLRGEILHDGTGRFDVIVLSDYNKGYLSPELCAYVISYARKHKIPVVVDPKSDWWKFKGATAICPNHKEYGNGILSGLFLKMGTAVLEKRGAEGIRLHKAESQQDFPAKAQHVFNVTGAGDTVVAVVAAVLGAGGTLEDGAVLANLAAGYCVGEIGTTVCPKDKLLELIK